MKSAFASPAMAVVPTLRQYADQITQTEAEIKRLTDVKRSMIRDVEAMLADGLSQMGTGTTTIVQGDVEVKVTRPKIVDWDQEALKDIVDMIRSTWNDDPNQYVGVKYSVSENAYNGWPSALRRPFEAARTVRAGATSMKFTVVDTQQAEE